MPVILDQVELPYIGTPSVGGARTDIHIQTLVPGPGPVGSHGYVSTAINNTYIPCIRDRATETVTCDGVYLGPWGKKPDDATAVRVIQQLMRTHPMYFSPSQNGLLPDQCFLLATVSYRGIGSWRWGQMEGTCTPPPVQPIPVNCTVSGPSTLSHANQQSTTVSGTIRDKWKLSCSNDTLVTVSTTRNVLLKNQTGEIASGLYVERTGVTTLDVFVERTADVYIVSELETPSASPGLYTGSGIIYVTWY